MRISKWLLFVSGVAFVCGAHAADLGQVMVDAVAEHLKRDTVPLTAAERTDLIWVGNTMPTFAYHKLDSRAAKRSVRDDISRAAAGGDASAASLARAAIESILRSMGHGASVVDLHGKPAGTAQPATPAVSFRQHESLRIVSLVRLEAAMSS